MHEVLILGGYGNFGKRIAELLTRQSVRVVIAGRNQNAADKLVASLPDGMAISACFNITRGLSEALTRLRPKVVIHTCGPFQDADYSVARTCIQHGIAYIDLADGRDFVTGFSSLQEIALKHGTVAISGASTVPGLSSAVLERYKGEFQSIDRMQFGIAPGQKAERGLATTQGILSYVGKRLKPCAGYPVRYGWQDMYLQKYPVIGRRWMANCDIPDLDLLPQAYNIQQIRFSAGMESSVAHIGIWVMSWAIRLGLPLQPARYSALLLKLSNFLNVFGSSNGGMHVLLDGRGQDGKPLSKTWFIVALNGHGPYIPTVPAVVLAKKILKGTLKKPGAMACIGMVSLEEYLDELRHLQVKTYEI